MAWPIFLHHNWSAVNIERPRGQKKFVAVADDLGGQIVTQKFPVREGEEVREELVLEPRKGREGARPFRATIELEGAPETRQEVRREVQVKEGENLVEPISFVPAKGKEGPRLFKVTIELPGADSRDSWMRTLQVKTSRVKTTHMKSPPRSRSRETMHRHLGWSARRIFCRSNADAERESGLTAVSAVRRALEARVRPNADRPRRRCTTLDDAENG